MNTRNRHLINVLSTGIIVTFVALTALFWGRWYCHVVRVSALNEGERRVQISPTGLCLFEKKDDPNLSSPSSATAELNGAVGLLAGLGATQYVISRLPVFPGSDIYLWEFQEDGPRFYFDRSLGLMVYRRTTDITDPNGAVHRRYVMQFAGSEGIANVPDEKLGRFVSPITSAFGDEQSVYEQDARRFFAIHWRDGVVRKGPELTEKNRCQPIQIGMLDKNWGSLRLTHRDPVYGQSEQSDLQPGTSREALYGDLPLKMDSFPVLILDASGRMDLLNPDTLELTPGVARLPKPPTLFPNRRPVRPEDVPAYCVYPVTGFHRDAQKKWAYAGCLAATVSRDWTSVELVAFDPNGRSVASQGMYPGPDEMYFSVPGASLVTAVQFALENLHPLASLLLSSLTASHVTADSAYQSLVLMPNSLAAMAARDTDLGRVNRFASSLVFMLPAVVLGVFLAWRASRDGVRMGLSKRATSAWIMGVFFLGLPGYVTYRLTRPKVALVTCANCGLGRRPDFEKCQRCGAPWLVPELVPPAWRVIGEPEEQVLTGPSPRPEETISNA